MLNVPQSHVGKAARCPVCGTVVRIRPVAGPGLKRLSPIEEQVGQWIAARADAVGDIPEPDDIREAHLPGEEPTEAEVAAETPVVEESPGKSTPRCPHCNHPMGRGQDICPYCGTYRGLADEKAGRRLQQSVRVAGKLRRLRKGNGGGFANGGAATAVWIVLVLILAGGVGALAYVFPAGGPNAIHGELLAVMALVVIGGASAGVASQVSLRGRPKAMTFFILLIVAGWVYQVTVTVQLLLGWNAVEPLRTVPQALCYGYLAAQLGIGYAGYMVLTMRRMSLAVLAVSVVAGIILLAIMRGTTKGIDHLAPFAYVDLGRTLVGIAGLWKFNDMMTE